MRKLRDGVAERSRDAVLNAANGINEYRRNKPRIALARRRADFDKRAKTPGRFATGVARGAYRRPGSLNLRRR